MSEGVPLTIAGYDREKGTVAIIFQKVGLSTEMPAMKAIGVRQFLDERAGKLTLAEAIASLKTETRRYAKRQVTWFRHQMADWPRQVPEESA